MDLYYFPFDLLTSVVRKFRNTKGGLAFCHAKIWTFLPLQTNWVKLHLPRLLGPRKWPHMHLTRRYAKSTLVIQHLVRVGIFFINADFRNTVYFLPGDGVRILCKEIYISTPPPILESVKETDITQITDTDNDNGRLNYWIHVNGNHPKHANYKYATMQWSIHSELWLCSVNTVIGKESRTAVDSGSRPRTWSEVHVSFRH